MSLDPRLVRFVGALEGYRSRAYQCSAGVWTIGFGQTTWDDGRPVVQGDITAWVEAAAWLEARLAHDRAAIVEMVHPELPAHAIDAATSFAYNVGMAGFKRSKARQFLASGAHVMAGAYLMNWVKPKVLKGRRLKEKALMQHGYEHPLVRETIGDEA